MYIYVYISILDDAGGAVERVRTFSEAHAVCCHVHAIPRHNAWHAVMHAICLALLHAVP